MRREDEGHTCNTHEYFLTRKGPAKRPRIATEMVEERVYDAHEEGWQTYRWLAEGKLFDKNEQTQKPSRGGKKGAGKELLKA